jgi:protease II
MELNPESGQVCDFFEVEFEDNYTFDSATLKYRLSTPSTPQRVFNFNMGTKRAEQIFFEQYRNSRPENVQCEKVNAPMRDGFEVPLVMAYDKQHFNEKSPWLLFSRGADSEKADLQFDPLNISLLNRGLCLCYPLVRGKWPPHSMILIGTRYFDDSWYSAGVGEKKLTHVMDFIDSAIFLKEKGLAPKIGVLGLHESGSITALASTFSEPLLFDCTVAHVRYSG